MNEVTVNVVEIELRGVSYVVNRLRNLTCFSVVWISVAASAPLIASYLVVM